MDKAETPFNIYLDLSKAFDTLNHTILLNKLKYYGINQNELNLFESYLTNRNQFVDIDGTKSEMLQISKGVQQGSGSGSSTICYLQE